MSTDPGRSSITIVDYGVGNIGSIVNMLKRIHVTCHVASTKSDLQHAKKILLPGVGAFDHGMTCFNNSGMREDVERKVLDDKIPTLGICVGAQMLGRSSEEGQEKGLAWVPMDTKKFSSSDLRIPHMGWNVVNPSRKHDLFQGMEGELRFYFVHSYYMNVDHEDHCLARTPYAHDFASIVINGHIIGVQFHPEKSHRFGMNFLYNFAACSP